MKNVDLIDVHPKTGINPDIMHKYNALGIEYYFGGIPEVKLFLLENPNLTYKKHYDGIDESVLASHNQKNIKMLDKLSLEAFETFVLENGTPNDLIEIIRKAYRIIYAKELDDSYAIDNFPGIEFQMQFGYEY